ncbi:MAG TPA: tetratricopeptide repeat protein [Thermomicrobiales bacterium]|nr:tetratricopeptide repeat protein [Thermomicrobiales bacterium]
MQRPRRVRPQPVPRSSARPTPREAWDRPGNRIHIVYIVISSLVVCSMLAVALATIDFSGLFGGDDENSANIVDPNADLISEQETKVAGNPNDVDEVVLLANLLGNTGRIRDAVPWYEKALELAPDDHGIRLDFARSLAGADLLPDAEAQFLRVLEDDPDNQSAHYYLAELYMRWDSARREDAATHYRRAVEIDPASFLAERAQIELDAMGSGAPFPSPLPSTPPPGT